MFSRKHIAKLLNSFLVSYQARLVMLNHNSYSSIRQPKKWMAITGDPKNWS
ncbi:hypothetical protein JCM19232_3373 [Vibrio ishigakensis]|uniref:Uncharacterized protein n=1 Tax=Vibrio ishigakensis TaxID=1481914 RepID=A0A0B8QIY1_9VIBR|nr:hypothetical protein JCM19232_3373 [Vibrio ishigakensis]GAM75098.1 hypothetical protein JCM19241_1441 [Vibrio ishigakensis]